MPKSAAQTRRAGFATKTSQPTKKTAGRTLAPETPLSIRRHGLEPDEAFDTIIRKRVGFKLGKFAVHLTRVSVRLEDLAGPKGKRCFACRIKTTVPSGESVVVDVREADVHAAFDVALDAHERAVRRMLERKGRT
ncbi:MAG: HPF/RaiA family ribosome-associated protein [Polyangiaceae bacterium]|nr:HPF/RaiA family ribosome-associated protein [Polyangiaceae bacterium]MBK8941316.1 HPF/RaiA family ribosome-associated protein [Polyangiaceae bacterium]